MLERHSVSHQRTFYRPSDLAVLPSFSLLPQAADAWNALSSSDKNDWIAAAAIVGFTGYNLFIQDKVYRIVHSIAGDAVPSLYHQYKVGHLNIPEGAGDVLLKQSGSTILPFPATLFLRRKSVLTADPANGEYVKLRFSYTYNEGGGTQTETTDIDVPLSSAWDVQSSVVTQHNGVLGPWTLELLAHAVKGDLYFDDVWVETASMVMSADPFCDRADKKWTRQTFPFGCSIESVYPQGGAL